MQKNENTVKTFDRLIAICQAQNASDIHFSVGQHPICRINGELVRLERLGTFTNNGQANGLRLPDRGRHKTQVQCVYAAGNLCAGGSYFEQ